MKTFTLAAVTVLALAGCTAQTSATAMSTSSAAVATVKPGAAVTLATVLPKTLDVGGYNTVELTFSESYMQGEMSVKVVPTEGLDLFGGQDSRTFDLASAARHDWSVDVSAQADGVYFLDVFVEAGGQARTFSVRLEIGTVTDAMTSSAMSKTGEMQDGLRVMEAEETIR